jgi:hypothetical protein
MANTETPITPSATLQKRAAFSKRSPFPDDQILDFDQLQDHPSIRIRDAERLYAQLPLDLEGGKLGGGFIHVRIEERSDAVVSESLAR